MFRILTEQGVIARAVRQNLVQLTTHNPRDFAEDRHNTVDDRPFGGGPGMVMMPEPMTKVIRHAKKRATSSTGVAPKTVYLSPQGKPFNHQAASALAKQESLVLIAGRYEGVDERVIKAEVDEEWSIGDYVLSGGELPAMVVIDAVTRLLPDSLGNGESAEQDSFVDGLLDCPHYTRPEKFNDASVPSVLLSGDHQAIKKWRLKQSLGRTWQRRPDLLANKSLTAEEAQLLEDFKHDLDSEKGSS